MSRRKPTASSRRHAASTDSLGSVDSSGVEPIPRSFSRRTSSRASVSRFLDAPSGFLVEEGDQAESRDILDGGFGSFLTNPRSFPYGVKQQCWDKAEKVKGRDPDRWRHDALGNIVFRKLVGCPGCLCHDYDHIIPYSKGRNLAVHVHTFLLDVFSNVTLVSSFGGGSGSGCFVGFSSNTAKTRHVVPLSCLLDIRFMGIFWFKGINDIRLAKKASMFLDQAGASFNVSQVNYTSQVEVMSSEKLPFILLVVFNIGHRIDDVESLILYAGLIAPYKKISSKESLRGRRGFSLPP
ncbi:hypothetical protein ZIOFF_050658 [Zingiber officinale]|uniref:Uncharacterized protein n=1 Tax=Zingiber officinale TaxID=94328 RepID=A0A8J5FKQ0_ZINOF|nr:hypothetical protein ZIOFF_050658 [Zingiber officinale]